jgi:hypothetical protein
MPHRIGSRPVTIFLTSDEGRPIGRPVVIERAVTRVLSRGGPPIYRAKVFGKDVDLRVKGHEEGYSCRFPEADAPEEARRQAGLMPDDDHDEVADLPRP